MKTYINKEGISCILMNYGKYALPTNSIVYIEGEGNYSVIEQINGKKVHSSFTMRVFSDYLKKQGNFFSPRKGLLLNVHEIAKVENKQGYLYAVLKNKQRHILSRRKGKQLLEYLQFNGFDVKFVGFGSYYN